MSGSSYNFINATGVIIADTSSILTTVQNEFLTVWPGMPVTPDTPQGVLITAETISRSSVANSNATLANQINPNIATGIYLDALMALTGQQRTAATPTLVENVTLTGVPLTVIPAGTQAQTAAQDLFQSTSDITLDSSGNGSVNFESIALGPIPCAIGALTQIVTSVLGWETVNNTAAGILGTATQSDISARALRRNTLAFQGVALAEAITSALYNVQGVQSLFFQENVANTTQTINGISMVPHSVYACVNGGQDVDVAAALLENKSSGAAWNGGTTIDVVEPASGQTYAVSFDRPDVIGILVKVITPNGNANSVAQSVLDYAAGLVETTNQNGVQSNLQGFVVGADVSPFEIASAIAAENPGIYIASVQISLVTPVSYQTSPIAIGVNEIAFTQLSYISVLPS